MFENWKITKDQLSEVHYQIELYDAQHWCQTFPEYEVKETEDTYEVVKKEPTTEVEAETEEASEKE